MVEEQETSALAPLQSDGDLLLYDYFKHLTSLSVIALGGILLIVQNIDPEEISRVKVLAMFVLVSLAGITAFHGASEVVKAKTSHAPITKSVYRIRTFAPLLLGGGVGVFLSLFMDALNF